MIRLVCLSALSRYARLCVVDARPIFAARALASSRDSGKLKRSLLEHPFRLIINIVRNYSATLTFVKKTAHMSSVSRLLKTTP